MKYKTTKKAVINGYSKVISVGYCALQTLLSLENPVAYTTRAEGWGADIYDYGNTAIVTGNAPFGNIRPATDINKQYEYAARVITNTISNCVDRQALLNGLINEYLQEVTACT